MIKGDVDTLKYFSGFSALQWKNYLGGAKDNIGQGGGQGDYILAGINLAYMVETFQSQGVCSSKLSVRTMCLAIRLPLL